MTTDAACAEQGFVRVPRAYMDLDISPGARSLVLFLCASANDDGESWHSYANIGRLIGRSKASIAAYVAELVEIGIVEAIEQKMANGYNYRRRLKLSQWRDFVARWREMAIRKKSRKINSKKGASEAGKPESSATPTPGEHPRTPSFSRPKTERRVQPAECKDPSGPNYTHQNKTPAGRGPAAPAAVVEWTNDDEAEWRRFRPHDSDPPSVTGPLPRPETGDKLAAIEENLVLEIGLFRRGQAAEHAETSLRRFARDRRLDLDESGLAESAEALAGIAPCDAALAACMNRLEDIWKPHWKRLPTAFQIRESLSEIASIAGPRPDLRKRHAQVSMRRWIYGRAAGSLRQDP